MKAKATAPPRRLILPSQFTFSRLVRRPSLSGCWLGKFHLNFTVFVTSTSTIDTHVYIHQSRGSVLEKQPSTSLLRNVHSRRLPIARFSSAPLCPIPLLFLVPQEHIRTVRNEMTLAFIIYKRWRSITLTSLVAWLPGCLSFYIIKKIPHCPAHWLALHQSRVATLLPFFPYKRSLRRSARRASVRAFQTCTKRL
jgi:hypothetical protein